ncbi:MAG: hypothetical protein ABIG90_01940 [bacterium]
MLECTYNFIKIFGLGAVAFFTAVCLTPVLAHFLYKYKFWKKEAERKVPHMGGLLIWLTVLILSLLFAKDAWLPLIILVLGSLVGMLDDFLSVKAKHGLRFIWRAIAVLVIGLLVGWLFYAYLGWQFFYIALAPIVLLGLFGGAPIDGLDGLAGGVIAPMFGAMSAIAFAQGQIDLAVFSAIVAGALLGFLYFNIPPARFFMGETGMIGLLVCLGALAFLTNSVFVLPIITLPLGITAGSIFLQIFWFQVFKKKLFYASPLHAHFLKMGWPAYKITMRYWIFATIFAIIGGIVALII